MRKKNLAQQAMDCREAMVMPNEGNDAFHRFKYQMEQFFEENIPGHECEIEYCADDQTFWINMKMERWSFAMTMLPTTPIYLVSLSINMRGMRCTQRPPLI